MERNRDKLGENNLYEHPESIFHPQGTFPYDLIAVRIFSVFLGMGTVLFTYLTARIFFPSAREAAILAAAIAAFLPQFTFITSGVSNDSIAYLLGAMVIFQYARMLVEPQLRGREYLILGVLLGLGALSKNSNLSLGIGLLLLVIRDFVRARKMVKGGLAWLQAYGLLVFGFILIAGWWYARNYVRYGDLLARQWIIEPEVFGWDAYARTLGDFYFQLSGGYFWNTLFQSFYGYFGFLNIRMPMVYYQLGLVFLAISAMGYPIFVLTNGKTPLGRFLLYLMPGVLLLGALVQLVAYNLNVSQPQGRYLFHTLSAFALFTTAGFAGILAVLREATPKLRDGGERSGLWREGMTWGLILAMAGVNLYALFGVLLPAYNINYLGLLFDAL